MVESMLLMLLPMVIVLVIGLGWRIHKQRSPRGRRRHWRSDPWYDAFVAQMQEDERCAYASQEDTVQYKAFLHWVTLQGLKTAQTQPTQQREQNMGRT